MQNTTSFEEMYKKFLSKVQDFKMKNLFLNNANVAAELCREFLNKAIAKFTCCKKDIRHVNETLGCFNVELDIVEKDILSSLMVEAWLDRLCLDVTQMGLTLQDTDFRHYAEAQNLDKKTMVRDEIREINAQDMWNYSFSNTDFSEWASGNYPL